MSNGVFRLQPEANRSPRQLLNLAGRVQDAFERHSVPLDAVKISHRGSSVLVECDSAHEDILRNVPEAKYNGFTPE